MPKYTFASNPAQTTITPARIKKTRNYYGPPKGSDEAKQRMAHVRQAQFQKQLQSTQMQTQRTYAPPVTSSAHYHYSGPRY